MFDGYLSWGELDDCFGRVKALCELVSLKFVGLELDGNANHDRGVVWVEERYRDFELVACVSVNV